MENKIVGTFCEKCRQIMCTCNNTTPPKEIYVSEFALAVLCKEEHTTIYINKVKQSDQITYLSEQSVLEMLSEKDKTIDNMAFGMQRLAKELIEKDKEIEMLNNKIELLKEDLESINMWLDENNYLKTDTSGNTYSIIGRIKNKHP